MKIDLSGVSETLLVTLYMRAKDAKSNHPFLNDRKAAEIINSIESAYYIADGITVMDKGRIIEEIDDISLFSELCHPFTSRLMHGLPISASATQDYNFYLERFKKGDTRLVTVKPGHRIEL